MDWLKIGRAFDTHLISSEMESRVPGILFQEGFLSPHLLSPAAQPAVRLPGSIQLLRISAPALGRGFNFLASADDGWHFL